MNRTKTIILALFLAQIILMVAGNHIFQKEANPFAVLVVSVLFTYYSFKVLSNVPATAPAGNKAPGYYPWLHTLVGLFGVFTAYEELRKIWVKYPSPEKISDVLPQLEAQCRLFFTGEYPYQFIQEIGHKPFPIYMPLHWSPIQISNLLHIDTRWTGIIMFMLAVGIAGYWLSKTQAGLQLKVSLPSMLLFALPIWAYVRWSEIDIAVSLEGVVACWYILLAAGLAGRVLPLVVVGLIGGILSRYTLLFWLFPFAALLWLNEPRKTSFWIWGIVTASVLALFIVPFLLKDLTIIEHIRHQYSICSEGSWLRPDEYTFKEGLSLNIHLRHWLPGNPEDNVGMKHYPQILMQFIIGGLGVYYYQKRWKSVMNVYTYSLLLLSIMPVVFYTMSPMLFRYYMLMPLAISAVLCWKVLNSTSANETH